MRGVRVGALPSRAEMTEAAFMTQVRRQARTWGWRCYHTHRSDRSDPGWPDLAFVHPVHRLFLVRELKTEKGRLTPDQRAWLDLLTAAGVDAGVWRPADLDNGVITRALFPRPVVPGLESLR